MRKTKYVRRFCFLQRMPTALLSFYTGFVISFRHMLIVSDSLMTHNIDKLFYLRGEMKIATDTYEKY